MHVRIVPIVIVGRQIRRRGDLFEVRDAGGLVRGAANRAEHGQEECGQCAGDKDYHQQFDERECRLVPRNIRAEFTLETGGTDFRGGHHIREEPRFRYRYA